MPWANEPGGGFTAPGVRTWLPMGDPAACNVADQERDLDSVLAFTRRAIAARRASEDLAVGSYRSLPSPEGTWAFARGEGTVVALNMSDGEQELSGLSGSIAVATDRALEGVNVDGSLALAPWTGVVITLAP
jgi:glycosidase